MFGFRIDDPLKKTTRELTPHAPDASLWPSLAAYLVHGRHPSEPAAAEALAAYLDLRDSLGAMAAFRAGAVLEHEALAGPCRSYFRGYSAGTLDRNSVEHWARFLLAADYLLGRAFEAGSQKGKVAQGLKDGLAREIESVSRVYLAPLAGDVRRGRTAQREKVAPRADSAPTLAAARAA